MNCKMKFVHEFKTDEEELTTPFLPGRGCPLIKLADEDMLNQRGAKTRGLCGLMKGNHQLICILPQSNWTQLTTTGFARAHSAPIMGGSAIRTSS